MVPPELRALLVHVAATWFMTGVIWTIQLVHYPLYAFADRTRFGAMIAAHSARITWVVGPAMLLELGTALWLLARPPLGVARPLLLTGLGLLAIAWASTAFLNGPDHGRLAGGYDATVHRRLVRTNWLRTTAWTLRAVLVACLLLQALPR